MTSIAAMLMCLFSYTGRSQHVSSAKDPPLSTTTPVAKELESIHMVTSCLLTHHSPCARSFCAILVMLSVSIRTKNGSRVSSSQPDLADFHECKDPPMGTIGIGGSSISGLHCSLPCSSQICRPNTRLPSIDCSEFLLTSPNSFRSALMQATGHIL